MLRYCLCMLAGAYTFILPGYLPSTAYLTSVAAVALLCMVKAALRMIAFFLCGLSLHWFAALQASSDVLPVTLEGKTLQATVVVEDFPQWSGDVLRLVGSPVANPELPERLRLSWYGAPKNIGIGETLSLQVRLRRPRGYANPHGFDYEAWLLRKGIGATGYVVAGERARRMDDAGTRRTTQFRRYFVQRVEQLLPQDDAAAVLMAIAVGARQHISRRQWDRYAVSGTSHLMAISGLHIGLAAAGAYILAWGVAGIFCRRANIRDIAMLCAICAALAYAQVSGFAVPARRASLMAVLAVVTVLMRRRVDATQILALACMLVFIGDPLSVLAPGFQLSFAAVALLLWHSRANNAQPYSGGPPWLQRFALAGRQLTAIQFTLLLGLFPLVATIFGRAAWVSVPVNLAVLPIFNVVTVPAALLGMLLDGPFRQVGDGLLRLAHTSIRMVLAIVNRVADWPAARLDLPYYGTAMMAAVILVASGAFLPRRWPGRPLAWIALAAVLVHRPRPPPPGCFDVHVLDVGQGLAAVVQTQSHLLVYDAGPAFRSGGDTGQLVLAPFVRKLGIAGVNTLIISHGDIDHAGGSLSLQQLVPVKRTLLGEYMTANDTPASLCEAGQGWQWDEVKFSILHPRALNRVEGNNASCVLEISAGPRRALLTGDIEARVEKALVARGAVRKSEFVTVPHHGSRTSSTAIFVDAAIARTAVVSNGYRNRWGLPKDDVADRWRASGARLLTTAESGAVSQRICADGPAFTPREARRYRARYWRQK